MCAPGLLCAGLALLAGTLAERSLAGLRAPLATGPTTAEVVLVGDPAPDGRGAVTVDVRLDGRRLRAIARLAAAAALDDRLAGERVTVVGEVRPPGPYERFLPHRHLAGRLAVDTVVGWRPGDEAARLANGLRRTLAAGAEVLPDRQASLLAGITLGDDRAQPPDLADAFRAAGLTHLLAVSGQNVAFALVVVAPLLSRLRFGPRLAATLAALALFALVTRAEPSVLRAVAMAAVAAAGAALGRPASAGRALALGVAAMVLVDPLLVTSLGFRLSVAGAAGIVAGAARVEAWLPGPRWLAAPLSVTLAAQAAVAPLLVTTFGSVPLASVPANLLAAPAAGPLMVWGLTGGLAAGMLGGVAARLLHLPTGLLLGWLEGVATAAARWPLGGLEARHLAVLGAAGLLLAGGRRLSAPDRRGSPTRDAGPQERRARPEPALVGTVVRQARPSRPVTPPAPLRLGRAVGGVATALGVLAAGLVVVSAGLTRGSAELAGPDGTPLGAGATLWVGGDASVLAVDGRARAPAVLAGLREAGAERVDVLVLRTGARAAVELADALARARPVGAVVVPGGPSGVLPGSVLAGATSPRRGTAVDVGGLRLTITGNADGRLDIEVTPRPRVSRPDRAPLAGGSGATASNTRSRRDGHRFALTGFASRGSASRPPILGRRDRADPPRPARRRVGTDRGQGRGPPVPGPGGRRRAAAQVRPRGRGGRGRRRPGLARRRPGRRVAAPPAGGRRGASGRLPVAMRATTADELAVAFSVGAHVVMVPSSLAGEAVRAAGATLGPSGSGEPADRSGAGSSSHPAVSVLVDDLDALEAARAQAEPQSLPLAFDSTAWSGAAATARESAAVAGGCRLLRSSDVRRSRRVAEVMAALLAARRRPAGDRVAGGADHAAGREAQDGSP